MQSKQETLLCGTTGSGKTPENLSNMLANFRGEVLYVDPFSERTVKEIRSECRKALRGHG